MIYASPEVPDVTARSEVWSAAATILTLCRLFLEGPIPPPTRKEVDTDVYYMLPQARRGVRDTSPGEQYSEELKKILRECLRFNAEHRPRSWQMLGLVRDARRKANAQFESLPSWVFSKSKYST